MRSAIRKKCQRYDIPGDAHELTFSCYERLPLLSRDRTRKWFIEAIEESRRILSFDLWAYVIMPEHAHLLIRPRDPSCKVSSVLWRIKRPVGRKAIAYLKENNSEWLARLTVPRKDGKLERRFWQAGGGYDRNAEEQRTVVQMIEYIHNNPVRRRLVKTPEEWEWSSARWYAGLRPVWLEMDSIVDMSSGT